VLPGGLEERLQCPIAGDFHGGLDRGMILAQATRVLPEQSFLHSSYLIRRVECSHDGSVGDRRFRARISPRYPGCQVTRRVVVEVARRFASADC
jgi:hypothetical protein